MHFFRLALIGGVVAAAANAFSQTSPQLTASQTASDNSSAQMVPVPHVVSFAAQASLDDVANRLNLTEQQLKLWNEFGTRVHAWEQNIYKEHPVFWSADANVVAEMGRLTMNQQNRLSLLEDLEASIKALYAGLNPEQQRTLNASLLQSIPGLLPNVRQDNTETGARKDVGRFGSGGSGRRRGAGMGGFGGMN